MAEKLESIMNAVDNIKSAYELDNSSMVAVDVAKLAAQVPAGKTLS